MIIDGFVLTGNVLLVKGSGRVVAWLLTEEGLVNGVTGDRRVGYGDSIWTLPFPFHSRWAIRVEGQIGVIKLDYGDVDELQVYRTDTGEVLCPTQEPRGIWDDPRDDSGNFCWGEDYLRFHNLSQCNAPLEDRW